MALSSRTVLAMNLVAAFTAAAITISGEPARSAEDAAVEARLQGNALAITAHATLRAPLPIIWDTLTDYDHLAAFIPGMKTSRVLSGMAALSPWNRSVRPVSGFFTFRSLSSSNPTSTTRQASASAY